MHICVRVGWLVGWLANWSVGQTVGAIFFSQRVPLSFNGHICTQPFGNKTKRKIV